MKKRIMAMLMAAALCVGSVPFSVMAEEDISATGSQILSDSVAEEKEHSTENSGNIESIKDDGEDSNKGSEEGRVREEVQDNTENSGNIESIKDDGEDSNKGSEEGRVREEVQDNSVYSKFAGVSGKTNNEESAVESQNASGNDMNVDVVSPASEASEKNELQVIPEITEESVKQEAMNATEYDLSNPRVFDIPGAYADNQNDEVATIWDCVWFGSYPQGDSTGMTKEPIKWRVLSVNGNDAFLLADQILDGQQYDNDTSHTSVTWENSSLRTWLNDTFLNTAFSSDEANSIKTISVVNDDNPNYGTEGGNNTLDKIYPLSLAEVSDRAYGFPESFKNAYTREANYTAYAKAQGTPVNSVSGTGQWWTRSPGSNIGNATWVEIYGGVAYLGNNPRAVYGVRPALHLDLSSSSWSYAGRVYSKGVYRSEYKEGTFSFETDLSKECLSYEYVYEDNWFFNDNTKYQHDLSKMSIRAAMAAFGSEDSAGPDNIKKLMEGENSLGFYNTVYSYPIPGYNTIGYAIGSKNIRIGENCGSLLMVAVRGGGYKDEWAGNFALGPNGTEHDGFLTAAKQVKKGIQDYIEKYKDYLDPNIKVWIFGYSRGAAIANLTASMLDRGEVPEVKPENVYAYCFECPQNTTSLAANDSKYSNIFSIVNPIDLVPKVAMSKWGFRRYGTTYYLPGLETNYLYVSLSLGMRELYGKFLLDNAPNKMDVVLKEYAGQANFLNSFMNNLADVAVDRNNYYYQHQANLMSTIAGLCGNSSLDVGAMGMAIVRIFPNLATSHPVNTAAVLESAAKGTLISAHYPELCMFWLDSLDQDTVVNGSSKYKYWFNNCPTDVNIYNSDDELVASFVNDEPQEIENGLSAFIDDNGQKVVVLPSDGDYHFEISAREAGEMSYTLAEYDMSSGRYESVTSFTGIQLKENDSFTGEIKNDIIGSSPTLVKDGEGKLSPDIVENGDSVKLWNVTVNISGDGTATGGGSFVSGSFSGHTATPNEGNTFAGWYIDDVFVSKDPEYRFCVTKDVLLTAKFEVKPDKENKKTSIGSASVSGLSAKNYTGKAITQNPVVKLGNTTLKSGTDYTVSYKNNTNAGTATVTIKGKGNYFGTITKKFTISKAANTLTVKAKTAKVKFSKLKKKKQTVKANKAFTVSGAQGNVTYKLVSVKKAKFKKYFKVSKAGKITIKKGLKKGTYKLKVKVTAAGNANYKPLTKSVTVKVKVK